MQEQRQERRRPRPIRSSIIRAAAALTASVLLLSACGTDSGGNGGGGAYTLHTLIVNASASDVVVSYAGVDDITLATCSAILQDFPLSDPFVVSLDGKAVLDSDRDLPDGLPNDGQSDLIVEITIPKDGAATFDKVRPGNGLTKPSKAAYCPSLPG